MRVFFADIADARDVIEVHIVIAGQADQHIEWYFAPSRLIVGIGPGRYPEIAGQFVLCEIPLCAEFIDPGLVRDSHCDEILSK